MNEKFKSCQFMNDIYPSFVFLDDCIIINNEFEKETVKYSEIEEIEIKTTPFGKVLGSILIRKDDKTEMFLYYDYNDRERMANTLAIVRSSVSELNAKGKKNNRRSTLRNNKTNVSKDINIVWVFIFFAFTAITLFFAIKFTVDYLNTPTFIPYATGAYGTNVVRPPERPSGLLLLLFWGISIIELVFSIEALIVYKTEKDDRRKQQ